MKYNSNNNIGIPQYKNNGNDVTKALEKNQIKLIKQQPNDEYPQNLSLKLKSM